ncbi:MAG: DsbE family thiol:disulfide interchange protein [Thiomicrorhabdus sp.]|nr:DsbE family thiol:disulfide interchange protein [Thiomicrorhabdus sp.]
MKRQMIPLAIFAGLVVILTFGLTLNPKDVPSPLIGKPALTFELPRLFADEAFSSKQLHGDPWLLNVWASWCVACKQEHQNLMVFAQKNSTPLIGLNYKDTPNEAKQWLDKLGNPYSYVVQDTHGLTGMNWGVYGVPETFVIDQQGVIRHKFTGPLTRKRIDEELMPLLQKLHHEHTSIQ